MVTEKSVIIEYVGADGTKVEKTMKGGERMGYEFMAENKTGTNFLKVYSDNETIFVPLHRLVSVFMNL